MLTLGKINQSLYTLVGTLVITVVIVVLGAHAAYAYAVERQRILAEIQQNSTTSIQRLRQNIATLIEAYAVNEYEKLVETEIHLQAHYAIIVQDYNLGKILDKTAYVSGKIHQPDGAIIDFYPSLDSHQQWLQACFYHERVEMYSDVGIALGSISIYISDALMKKKLRAILIQNLINSIAIAVLLIILLFIAIRHFLIRPLSQIAQVINQCDEDGIPLQTIPDYKYREISILTESMNTMVAVIRKSRQSLKAEHDSLERSLRINRLILETLPDLLWLKDIEGRYLLCNPNFEQFFGAKEADIIGKTDYDFVSKALADFFRKHDRNAMAAGQPTVNEEWITFASDGRRVLLETTKMPLVEEGKITGVMGIAHDITERYQTHQQVLKANAREIALNQSLPTGILVYDTDLRCINFANDSAARILEMDKSEIIATGLNEVPWQLFDDDDGQIVKHQDDYAWIVLTADDRPQHWVLGLDFSTHRKWLSINSKPFYVDKTLAGSIVSFTDISQERKTIEALILERRRFKLAIEGTQDGLWDWQPDSDSVFFSKQWKNMLGYAEHEIGDSLEEWNKRIHPEDKETTMSAFKAHLRGETPVYENRHRLKCKDGSWIWILSRGKALFNTQGMPIRIVGFHSDITEQVQHQKALEHSAKHDALTHLPNRFLFNELVQNAMTHCQQQQKRLALLYIDLDGFKVVNDTYGHEAGDQVLITAAQRMQFNLREEDVIARLGGDEFVIAITGLSRQDELLIFIQRLLQSINRPIYYQNQQRHELYISASIGVTYYPQTEEVGPEALLRQADQAMYEAKTSGKNQYCLFNLDEDSSIKQHLQMIQVFHRAIEHEEFVLHYQPKVDMTVGKVVGFEALLRWQHPEEGLLYPDDFLPQLHQEKNLMIKLGRWVFETAFAQLSCWQNQGYRVGLNLNVSAHEFKSEHIFNLLKQLQKNYPDIEAKTVELEILETSALEDIQEAIHMIKACQQLGFKVALDDFGTGYSTLSYLKDLPVDTLKLDKSFVLNMLHDSASLSIIEAAMGLAEAFRCQVIAEGVESCEHGVMLLQLGCHIAQGFTIAKPMPAEQVLPWLGVYQANPIWQRTQRLSYKDRSVLYATIEHDHWLQMLIKHQADPDHCPLPELDPTQCRFGVWLQGEALEHHTSAQLTHLECLHTHLHKNAHLLKRYRNPKRLHHMTHLHQKIRHALDRLIAT